MLGPCLFATRPRREGDLKAIARSSSVWTEVSELHPEYKRHGRRSHRDKVDGQEAELAYRKPVDMTSHMCFLFLFLLYLENSKYIYYGKIVNFLKVFTH